MITEFAGRPGRMVEVSVDGRPERLPEGSTILDACQAAGIDTPTLCRIRTLTPVNTCRACVVELEDSRTLVPACSRPVEPGMAIATDTERVRHSRRLVLELLASSVDLSAAGPELRAWMDRYEVRPDRFGSGAERVAGGPRIDNQLYVRDAARCILCYRCVEACGADAQNTFAIAIAGRGFAATVATEFDSALPDSACVYCGNCVAVCPTGALMFKDEFDLRQAGGWDEARQRVTSTICPYCGVGCTLDLHVQDNRIVKVTSPLDHDITRGSLCIKGRFGYRFVQRLEPEASPESSPPA